MTQEEEAIIEQQYQHYLEEQADVCIQYYEQICK